MKVSLILNWANFCVGLIWDKRTRFLYILPFPMFGVVLKFGPDPVHAHVYNNHTYTEGETVQLFQGGRWWSGELSYEDGIDWYVQFAEGYELIQNWDYVRPNVLEEDYD